MIERAPRAGKWPAAAGFMNRATKRCGARADA